MIVLDIETSGGEFLSNGIFQIGALDSDNPRNEFFETCRIDDDDEVVQEAMDITGVDEKKLRNKSLQSQKVMIEKFIRWMSSAKIKNLLCHNPQFDNAFIRCKMEKYGLENPIPWQAIDLHSIASLKFFQVNKRLSMRNNASDLTLSNILRFCGIEDPRNTHNALEDARLTAECYSRIMYGKNLIREYKRFPVPKYLRTFVRKIVLKKAAAKKKKSYAKVRVK